MIDEIDVGKTIEVLKAFAVCRIDLHGSLSPPGPARLDWHTRR
jgi:hypothetical protein